MKVFAIIINTILVTLLTSYFLQLVIDGKRLEFQAALTKSGNIMQFISNRNLPK